MPRHQDSIIAADSTAARFKPEGVHFPMSEHHLSKRDYLVAATAEPWAAM